MVDPHKYSREMEIEATRPKSAGMRSPLLSSVPDAVQVWKAMPPKSRERSSTEQWLKAWNEARKKGLPPISEMLDAVEAWKRSGKWAEDGGRWQEGAHRWLAGRQWENLPMSPMQADEEMLANVMARFQ